MTPCTHLVYSLKRMRPFTIVLTAVILFLATLGQVCAACQQQPPQEAETHCSTTPSQPAPCCQDADAGQSNCSDTYLGLAAPLSDKVDRTTGGPTLVPVTTAGPSQAPPVVHPVPVEPALPEQGDVPVYLLNTSFLI